MPLNKLENFIKNYEGRILYVNSNDLDATDSITNQGNSLTKPFKTIQRALIESARFSFITGNDNDRNDRTTILVFPGEHVIDNRPGYGIRQTGTSTAQVETPSGQIIEPASSAFDLTLESNFDLTQEDNVLYKFNSIYGGVIIPRGTSLIGLDLRKTKIRPKYVPNPTDPDVPNSAYFRITGNCYFWQFSIFDANESELVYTDNKVFSAGSGNLAFPTFSHHKLTVFEYADGVNVPVGYDITDLDMYYAKLSRAFNEGSGRQIPAAQKFPLSPRAFAKERPEWEIVGAFATDPIDISNIISGDGATPGQIVTVTTIEDHGLTVATPIKIRGVEVNDYNVSTVVQSVQDSKTFTYLLPYVRNDLDANPPGSATVTIETDTVKGASPYIFNCSLRSVWGLNGMKSDGKKASGFKSMVVAQYTAVSLQKDDRAFVKYNPVTRNYTGIPITKVTGSLLSSQSASINTETVYHLDSSAIYRPGWEPSHIKIINDAFIQIVSVFAIGFNKHFDAQSGGDGSVTNSNSNFGQYSLACEGFKVKSFSKDDHAFITSIITPKYITPTEENVDWISVDVGLTTSVGITSHLYLYGFNTEDNVPPNLIQGYRVGARLDETLYLTLPSGEVKSAKVLMTNNVVGSASTFAIGTNSAVKEYTVSATTTAPNYDTLTLSSDHNLQTGEKIIILSDNGDLPENIKENKQYYVIKVSINQIKLASSFTNAQNGFAVRMYGGQNIRILSRVSDINSGELGSPIQYDPNNSNWFVHVNANNEIYNSIKSLGVSGFDEPRTDTTFIKRIEDSRSLDERIYKVRIVIPKESVNAKNPTEGFVLQESNSTGLVNDSELSLSNITVQNYNYKRNPRFISTCSESNGTVTVISELPHNLTTGDRVFIRNVKSSTNLTGLGVTNGYNGDFTVTVVNDKTFTYPIVDNDGLTHNVGIFSGFSVRDSSIPRFERNDWKSNFFIYRLEVLSEYEYNTQDGIYHAYLLKSDVAIPNTFTDYKYNQNIVDLYPQKDPDNINDNPKSAVSFAKRTPLGEVVTNDLKNSITRETLDSLIVKIGASPIVQSVSSTSNGIATITTTQAHGLNGIVGYTTISSGNGYSSGTHFNVKLINSNLSWNGATADVVVSGAANSITSLKIVSGGSGYGATTLSIQGFSGSTVAISTQTISSSVNNSIQITGIATGFDGLYRIVSVPGTNTISIAKTSGDSSIIAGQYLFNVSPSIVVNNSTYNSNTEVTSITCTSPHGLSSGNKIKIVDNSNNFIGDYVINDVVGINTFTIKQSITASNGYRILKHGFSSNDLISEPGTENLAARGVPFYANETALLLEDIGIDTVAGVSTFAISATNSGISTLGRFPLGSYIQINNEIMRISSSVLSGSSNNKITVIRGALGTQKENHYSNSLIKKIKPIAVEFRRPSILRASGHTFEYLGFGPGNYSTGLPQIQTRTLTERADFLSQSQEKSCGSVVYTGMNSDGDFFIGNTKYSSASGQQTTFDIPIPTITGQDPSRLSAVFDEVVVKERILVEGGKSKKILSQFDGPVTFNENIIINNDQTKINGQLITSNLINQKNSTNSTSTNTGSIVTKGGVGIVKDVNIGGSVSVAGTATFSGEVQFNSGLVPDSFEDAYIGSSAKPWASAWIAGIGIATEGVPGGTEVQDRTINAWTGNLVLTSTAGIVSVTDSLEVTNDLLVKNNSTFTGLSTFKSNTRHEDNVKSLFGDDGDLEIFHDGSNSFIKDTGTGSLIVTSNNLQVKNAANNETGLTFTQDGSVELYFNNSKKLDTTNDGVNITGITISSGGFFPLSDSGAPLGSLSLSFSEAFVDNLKLDGNVISSTNTNGNITLTPNGTGVVETVNDVNFGTSGYNSTLSIVGQLNADNLRLDGNTFSSTTGNITIDSAGGSITLADHVSITGVTTFSGEVMFNTGIVPDANLDAYIGKSGSAWSEAWIGKLKLAVGTTGDTETTITTSANNLVLDSSTGTTKVDDNLWTTGTLQIDSTSSFRDNVVIEGGSKTLSLKDATSGNVRVELSSAGAINLKNTAGTNLFSVDSSGNTSTSGTLKSTNTTDSTNSTDTSASLSCSGGASIAKKLNVGNTLTVTAGGLSVTAGGLSVTAGGLTVSSGGISASGQTITATTFSGNATTATTAANVVGSTNRVLYNNGTNTTTTSSNLTFDGAILGTSDLKISGSHTINSSSPTIYLQDTDNRSSMIHCNSNLFYILRGSGTNSKDWIQTNGRWPLTINLENNNAEFGGSILTPGSIRVNVDNNTTGGTALSIEQGGDIVIYSSTNAGSSTLSCNTDKVLTTDSNISALGLSVNNSITGSSLSVTGSVTNGGFDFILGNSNQSSRGNSGASRALVKDSSSTLVLNYGGDFTGGVRVDSGITINGNINASGQTVTATTFSGNATTSSSSPLLSSLSNYVWSSSTLPYDYSMGIQCSFVSASQGFPEYGSVMTMKTYSGGGGSLQLYVPYSPSYGGTGLQVRFGNYANNNGNSWTAWKTLLASDNYNSYAIARGGDTVDNIIYFRTNKGGSTYLQNNSNYSLQAYSSDGGSASMSFHRGGYYAINIGLDPDNVFRIGGWSDNGYYRLQIDSSGNLTTKGSLTVSSGGINASGQTVTATTFSGNATTATTASNVVGGSSRVLYNNGTNTTTTSSNLTFDGTNLSVGGDITAFASDERLKTNIQLINNALEKVCSLRGFTYNFNEIGESLGFDPQIRHSGVSAQEIKSVLPEAVCPAPSNNDYLTVKYEKLVPLLIEAIKDLSEKIEKLEQKILDK